MKEYDSFFMSEKQIEQLKRKRKFNKQMAKAGKLFLGAIATFMVFGFAPDILINYGVKEGLVDIVAGLSIGSSGALQLASIMTFAKSLHDPLTEAEAKELAEKEEIEKGGFKK